LHPSISFKNIEADIASESDHSYPFISIAPAASIAIMVEISSRKTLKKEVA